MRSGEVPWSDELSMRAASVEGNAVGDGDEEEGDGERAVKYEQTVETVEGTVTWER